MKSIPPDFGGSSEGEAELRWESVVLAIYQILFLVTMGASVPSTPDSRNIRTGLLITSGLALVLIWRL